MRAIKILSLVFLSTFLCPLLAITCLSSTGSSSSWFFILKYPLKIQSISDEDHKYVYFDDSMGSSDFQLRNRFVDDSNEALYSTFNQINKNSDLQVIAWNDEPADDQSSSSHSAHSKGVIMYDAKENNGVYIVHSIPKYPAFDTKGHIDISIPTSEKKFGQNLLCMSLDGANLDEITSGLDIIGTTIYYNSYTSKNLPNLYGFSQGSSVKNKANSMNNKFKVDGTTFLGFYKNPYYETGFIFEDIMTPVLKKNLLVESWGRPYQAPSCDKYQVVNIKNIKIGDDKLGVWDDEDDHSKWGITDSGNYVCSGDMNRMTSQAKRGGAFFCFVNKGLWKSLNSAVAGTDSCGSSFLSI